jgi:hypothetical protein
MIVEKNHLTTERKEVTSGRNLADQNNMRTTTIVVEN